MPVYNAVASRTSRKALFSTQIVVTEPTAWLHRLTDSLPRRNSNFSTYIANGFHNTLVLTSQFIVLNLLLGHITVRTTYALRT